MSLSKIGEEHPKVMPFMVNKENSDEDRDESYLSGIVPLGEVKNDCDLVVEEDVLKTSTEEYVNSSESENDEITLPDNNVTLIEF